MLDTVTAAFVLSVVGMGVATTVQVCSERVRIARDHYAVATQLQAKVASFANAAANGTLTNQSLNQDLTVPGLPWTVNFVTSVTTDPGAAAGDVKRVIVTATWDDGHSRSLTLESALHNKAPARKIGVKFRGATTAALSSTSKYGHFAQANWNSVSNPSQAQSEANAPVDSLGQATTLRYYASVSSGLDNSGGVNPSAETDFSALFSGGLRTTSSTGPTITITGIPYARYTLVVYVNVFSSNGGYANYRLGNRSWFRNYVGSSSYFQERTDYTVGRNTLIYTGLSGSTQVITSMLGTQPPMIHGFQVVEETP